MMHSVDYDSYDGPISACCLALLVCRLETMSPWSEYVSSYPTGSDAPVVGIWRDFVKLKDE